MFWNLLVLNSYFYSTLFIVYFAGWNYFGIYLFTRPNLFVTDLDLIKNIMTKDFTHFVDRGFYHNPENENISKYNSSNKKSTNNMIKYVLENIQISFNNNMR